MIQNINKLKKKKQRKSLIEKYPPSVQCNCEICVNFCKRPGWWTVNEAVRTIDAGYAKRMMLEMSPDKRFGVLSPAFKGCESAFALNLYESQGCTFFINNLCELHGTGHQPLECRFCHHDRMGLGPKCHEDIEKDWNSESGRNLIVKWANIVNFGEYLNALKAVEARLNKK